MIVAEHLFVQIPEEVKWLGADVGSLESALEQAPEVFEPVCVDLPVNVAFGMVNYSMDKILVQSLIGEKRIGVNGAASGNMISDFGLNRFLAAIRNDARANFAATLQDSHDRSLVLGPSSGEAGSPLVGVHESRRAADESFVHFDFATHPPERFILQGQTNAVKHEPRGFLSDAKSARNFVGANPVLAVGEHPSRREPLVEADWRILEDGAHLDGELALGVMGGTLPDTARGAKGNTRRAASRADNPFGPAACHKVVEAIIWIREVKNRFLEALRFSHGLVLLKVL